MAVVLLAASDYYPFVVFFKVFLLVVVFGLFHGLVLLPSVLSVIGPSAPSSDSSSINTDSTNCSDRGKPDVLDPVPFSTRQ